MASNRRAGSTRPTPATNQTTIPGRERSARAAPVPSGTNTCVGLAPTTSTSRCDGSRTLASTRSTGRALASLRARRLRHRSSPWLVRTASASRSGRSSSAAPVSSGQPSTATGWSAGKGRSAARRSGVWSSRIIASASHAASDGSGAASTARAQPPERGALGVVVEQTPAGDDERGGIVVELAQAVGRLGDEEPVVAAVAGDGAEAFERLHRAQPTGRRSTGWSRRAPGRRRGRAGRRARRDRRAARADRAPSARPARTHPGPATAPRAWPRPWRGR